MIKFNIPYVSTHELELIKEVILNKSFAGNNSYSKLCEQIFEKKYAFNKCYLTPSCTSAIEMASLILDLNAGDEIIVPSYTFASCPNPFIIKGVKVVLADCEENYPNVSVQHIQQLITEKTKAIMIMHYGGVACNLMEIKSLCDKNKLYLIEDAAQCIDAFYNKQPLGSFGDLSVFSFHETKNIHSGEGGMLVINNPKLIEKAEIVRQYGTNRTEFLNNYLSHYESIGLGLSFFQSEINAAFLYAQIQDIDSVSERRKELWNCYYKGLEKIASDSTFKLPQVDVKANSNNHTFFITVCDEKDTNPLIDFLNKNHIAAVKHFYPLHQSKFYKENQNNNDFPNTTNFNNRLIRLPLHYYLTNEEIDYIVEKLKDYFNQN